MLNPITFTEKVVGDFLRYQLSTYGFADDRLNGQLRCLLSLEETRDTPLLKGPYISLSKSFRQGRRLAELAAEGVIHPHLANLALHPAVWGHQEEAIRAIAAGSTTLISTGTGSGKTECFLYPVISRCLALRDENAIEGIVAVLVYPMNALAEDQLGRLRELLAGTGISFGMYVGKTPERTADVPGVRLGPGSSREDYRREMEKYAGQRQAPAVHPVEERVSREEMRTAGKQPRILLTNVKQLELLLTRQKDYELFQDARLEYLVFDEAHTFSGAAGAETACLIRRLRAYCGKNPDDAICVGTSATIVDKNDPDAAKKFASRFFGVPIEKVAVVTESYEEDVWAAERKLTAGFAGDPGVQLRNICDAVSGVEGDEPPPHALDKLRAVFQAITGTTLDASQWQEALYDRLATNEVVFQIAQALATPRDLKDLLADLETRVGRRVPEEEILSWLALGAASSKAGRPLLRPVVHAFVQGVPGAVVTFPAGNDGPKLWLSAEAAGEAGDGEHFRLSVMSCTTCGQHYFQHWLEDYGFTERAPGGGEAVDGGVVWRPLEEQRGGKRAVLVDRLAVGDLDDGGDSTLDRRGARVWFCRRCGALHPKDQKRCLACGVADELVALWAIRVREDPPEKLTSCLGCGAGGRRLSGVYREPARPLKATPVADVHVLAQSMVQHAERKRLLTFADNRQDAAFQAGWMQDHARRYRLRSLMHQRIKQGPVSVGDLTSWLDEYFEADEDLSRALLPEVWRVERREVAGKKHRVERKKYLRIQVLRELTAGGRQRIGLEPWGRIVVDYLGLDPMLPFFARWAPIAGCSPEELREGVASLLDSERRTRVLLDPELRLYSRYWHESDREVMLGYIPDIPGGPSGLKIRRRAEDEPGRVRQWVSERGDTVARQAARAWGLPESELVNFLEELWKFLSEELNLLVPVRLTGKRDKALPGCAGVRQIDADRLLIGNHNGVYRCDTCKKPHPRTAPKMACTVWRCRGTLHFEAEDPDNYDLLLLDQDFAMLRAREHSAQIPTDERELLERNFKSDSERVNTLVCTPTLELGVDIGALDSVLMRNVPPLPANYWQRVGRAGRRQRMAVNLTYCRPVTHDRAYFAEPLKMLGGAIGPPSINLRNSVMVEKHSRASVLTTLHRLSRDEELDPTLTAGDRQRILDVIASSFPTLIRDYLFLPSGDVRREPFSVAPFGDEVEKHRDALLDHLRTVFSQCWPEEDRLVVEDAALDGIVERLHGDLQEVIGRLRKRLEWALTQMERLDAVRLRKGTLDPEEESLRRRCDRLVKKLKAVDSRRRHEAEGYDDSNTYAVLAAEGYLPGYGLDTGWVVGSHLAPPMASDIRDWELRRNSSLAVREYIPGNLIYANGHRFVARQFHLHADQPVSFQVDAGHEALVEVGTETAGGVSGIGTTRLQAVEICDVDLPHQSQISDDEDYRFQLPVAVYGIDQKHHEGGKEFSWGGLSVTHRRGVRLRLVTVGAAKLVRNGDLGFPVCTVCGQSRSPLSSQRELQTFIDEHQERCRSRVDKIGFFANVTADALTLRGCRDQREAYSLAEALRHGAAEVLEMEREDLQILSVGRPGDESPDILIYDPMPGGSGLLSQMIDHWGDVVVAGVAIVNECPSLCESACVDCLLHYRNTHYHRHLDRMLAVARLGEVGEHLRFSHDIPPALPGKDADGETTNTNEENLRVMLDRAGFVGIKCQYPIDLGKPLGVTTPDFYFDDPEGRFEGICIYLDGMSKHLHGNPVTAARDRQLREELRSRCYDVIEIRASQLTDAEAMRRHFRRLARVLLGRIEAQRIEEDTSWFGQR